MVTDVLQAAPGVLWPLLVAVVVWKAWPSLRQMLSARAFTIKIGDNEFSVQEMSEQLLKATVDIQSQLAIIEPQEAAHSEPVSLAPPDSVAGKRLLWLGQPGRSDRFEIAQLTLLGIYVERAETTMTALRILQERVIDIIVTHMGRVDANGYDPRAGKLLIEVLRASGINTPVVIYDSVKAVSSWSPAGEEEVSASSTTQLVTVVTRQLLGDTT